MCGIFAIYSFLTPHTRKEIVETLLRGLETLEYRGYDSAGIAFDAEPSGYNHGSDTTIYREVGNLKQLRSLLEEETANTDMDVEYINQCSIAHTRWATHGAPSRVNSHPHVSDEDGTFVVVHNGIVTNWKDLKKMLASHGYHPKSETDTEIVAMLILYIFNELSGNLGHKPSFKTLMKEVSFHLEGAYALIVKSKLYPNELIACKLGSPLVLGIADPLAKDGEGDQKVQIAFQESSRKSTVNTPMLTPVGSSSDGNNFALSDELSMDNEIVKDMLRSSATEEEEPMEYFLASDASALIAHTKRVMYLEDDDFVHLKDNNFTVYRIKRDDSVDDASNESRVVTTLQMELDQIRKGSFDHFMQKEIFEQTDSCLNSMAGRINFETHTVKLGGISNHLEYIRRCRRIIMIACGTSYHAAVATRQILEDFSKVPISLELASDMMDRNAPIFRDDVCVFISQSGETADTLAALRYCKELGALCIGITNTVGSAIARLTDCGVHVNAGVEIGVASTKAYTSQVIVLILFALSLGEDYLSLKERHDQIIDDLATLSEKIGKTLECNDQIKELAIDMKDAKSLLIMGRGMQYATCVEAALKIKEISYIHSEGILAGELKHGPIALIDESMPVILIATKDDSYDRVMNAVSQVSARSGQPIVLVHEDDDSLDESIVSAIKVPKVDPYLQCIINVLPMQLLSYHLACVRELNVDQPRNLAKSVTVE